MTSELKLSLDNFQSISNGELVFKTGLNFIIGQSNSGKSATFRALKACLTNPAGSQRFIKWNANKSAVTLSYAGNEITWERTSKESKYTINGEVYLKTGRSDAFKILDNDLGFARDDNDNLMNIEEELQLPFPFGTTKTELFKLFENVFCVSDSAVISKSAKEHENGVRQEVASLNLELTKNEVKLRELSKFKEELDMEKLKEAKMYLISKRDRLNLLKQDLPSIKICLKLDKENLKIGYFKINDLTEIYKELVESKDNIIRAKKFHVIEKGLDRIKLFNKDNKVEEHRELKKLQETFNNLRSFNDLSVPIKEFEDKLVSHNTLIDAKKQISTLEQINNVKIATKEFEDLSVRYLELRNILSFISKVKADIKRNKDELTKKQEEIKEFEDKLSSFDVCPLCHSKLK